MKKNSKNLKSAFRYLGFIAVSAMLFMGSACTSTTKTPLDANSVPPSDAQKWIKRLNNGHYPDYQFVKHTPVGEAILKPLAADTALRVKFYFGYSSVDKESSLFSLFAKGVEEAGKYTIDTNVVFHFNGKDWEPCSFMLLKEEATAWAQLPKTFDFKVNSFLVPRADITTMSSKKSKVYIDLGCTEVDELKMLLNLVSATSDSTLKGSDDYLDALCPCPPVCAGNEP
ncbi:MAG TPA: hypothetical protein VMW01_07115 [Williamwhitmania sp.]|nr:hypothetical protein [Williamwhitmania sp.]